MVKQCFLFTNRVDTPYFVFAWTVSPFSHLAILHMRRLSPPFLNHFIKSHAFPAWIPSPRVETFDFDNLSKHTEPIAMKYTAFVALIAILPAAFAMVVDSSLGKRECVATACPCHGAPNAAFCGDGLSSCLHGHRYQCNNDGKSSCDLGSKPDTCPQAAGLN
ncbi:hypothetical protein JB92DRAFT_2823213 [Gautieria morchelliformis]|nr:hypothetical protein JB92DRAFT_2823213 [Gautieria morchelliformis]